MYQSKRKPLFPMSKDGKTVLADRDCKDALLAAGYVFGEAQPAEGQEESIEVDRDALAYLTRDQLRDLLQAAGLDTTGNKPELIERLATNGIGPELNRD